MVYKQVKLAQLVWRYGRFRKQLKRDPTARHYTDLALTPMSEHELDCPEMFTLSAAAKSPLIKVRQPGEARAATTSANLSS